VESGEVSSWSTALGIWLVCAEMTAQSKSSHWKRILHSRRLVTCLGRADAQYTGEDLECQHAFTGQHSGAPQGFRAQSNQELRSQLMFSTFVSPLLSCWLSHPSNNLPFLILVVRCYVEQRKYWISLISCDDKSFDFLKFKDKNKIKKWANSFWWFISSYVQRQTW